MSMVNESAKTKNEKKKKRIEGYWYIEDEYMPLHTFYR